MSHGLPRVGGKSRPRPVCHHRAGLGWTRRRPLTRRRAVRPLTGALRDGPLQPKRPSRAAPGGLGGRAVALGEHADLVAGDAVAEGAVGASGGEGVGFVFRGDVDSAPFGDAVEALPHGVERRGFGIDGFHAWIVPHTGFDAPSWFGEPLVTERHCREWTVSTAGDLTRGDAKRRDDYSPNTSLY